MPDMTDAMLVFDRALLRRRRDRAARGSDFARADFLAREVADRLADRLLDIQERFPRALELGCRGGALATQLDDGRGGIETLIRLELSPAMASLAARTHPAPVAVADEERLPVRGGAFDLVVSNLALHWVNDLPGALIQARRVLRPNGLLLASLLGGETLVELRDVLLRAEAEVSGGAAPRVSPFADLRDMGGLLQRAGFALPVVDSDRITVTYPHLFALLAELRAMGETSVLLERSRRPLPRPVLLRAASLYQEMFGDADGRIPATFQILYLHGWAPHASQPRPLKPGSAALRLAEALETVETVVGRSDAGPAPGDATERS